MSNYPRIILGVSSTQIYKNTDNNNLNFYNNNLNIISLDSSGNVGIGDITPSFKLDVNGTGRFTSNLTVDGDLTVSGTTITMNASTIEVEDPLISLSSNNSADVTDIGFYGQYNDGTVKYSGLFRDANDSGQYKLFKELQEEPTTTINTSGTGYTLADFECANINLTGDISINGVVQSFGGGSSVWTEASSTATYDGSVVANGNVGIGIANPDQLLHIHEATASTSNYIHLTTNGSGSASTDGLFIGLDSAQQAYFNNKEDKMMLFMTNDTTRMMIQPSSVGANVLINNNLSIGHNSTPLIHLAIGDSDTGFHSMGDGELAWYSNHTRRAYLTSAGNFCIGHRDIRDEVVNTGLSEALIFADNNSYADDRYLLTCWQDSSNTHQIGFEFDYYTGSGNTTTTHSRVSIISNANNDEAINDSGKFRAQDFYSNGFTQIYRDTTSATTDCLKVKSNYGSTAATVAVIEANGDFESLSNSYGGVSDMRLKENIVDANSQWEDIKSIKFRKFNFKNTPNKIHMGVVAQELELTSPGLIKTRDDEMGTKSVKTSIMYMKGMKALQEAMQRIEGLETEDIKERLFVKNIINSQNKYKVFNESTFSKINGTHKPLDIINDMYYIQYMDNNNNVKKNSPETTPIYYGVGEESLNKYMNVYDKDSNRILPTIYRKGKLLNNEIELYNHLLNQGEQILVKFTIDNVKYEEEILVTEIIDTTHIKIDNTKLQQYLEHINNRNIFIYGKRQKNVNILNEKFLYSLSSLSLSGIKELTTKFHNKTEETFELINIEKQENNKQNTQIKSNTENVNNIATKFNTLVQEHMIVKDLVQKSAETINKLLLENNNLKNTINTLNNEKELNKKNIVLLNDNFNKQNNINQNNLNLLNEHIKKQQILINQLIEKDKMVSPSK